MTITAATYTDLETQAMKAIIELAMDVIGGECAEDVKIENCSYFYPKEIVKATGWSQERTAGVLGSLVTKGIIDEEQSQNPQASKTEFSMSFYGVDECIRLGW